MTEKTQKLQAMQAVSSAIKFVFGNLGHLFATAALTLFVVLGVSFVAQVLTIDTLVELQHQANIATRSGDLGVALEAQVAYYGSPSFIITTLVTIVVSFIFSGMFAIRWHRSALYGSDSENTGFGIEFSPSLWRYILSTVLLLIVTLFLILLPYGILITSIAIQSLPLLLISTVFLLSALVFVLYAIGRLSLVLPAAALSIPNFGLRQAWQTTKGHGWRILWAQIAMILVVIAALIPVILVALNFAPGGDLPSAAAVDVDQIRAAVEVGVYATTAINALLTPIFTGLFTSLLSYIYFQIGQPPQWVIEAQRG